MTDKTQEALKLALDALIAAFQGKDKTGQVPDAITAICEALAEQPAPQQEPVAWLYPDNLGRKIVWLGAKKPIIPRPSTAEPLYTHPPASKPWVGLTDEERDAILDREFKQWWSRHDAVCRAIEAKLREKNA